MHLVRTCGDHVRAGRDFHPTEPLDRVAQHPGTHAVRNRGDFGYRLNDANFIVDQHRSDQCGTLADRLFHVRENDPPVPADGENRHVPSACHEPFGRVEHGGMLARNDNQLPTFAA